MRSLTRRLNSLSTRLQGGTDAHAIPGAAHSSCFTARLAGGAEGQLTVYTYESFTAEWGPGPQVEKAFEAECACDLQFVSAADGVALLNRVKLEGAATKADVVLGLDTNLTAEARATGLFAPHGIDLAGLVVPAAGPTTPSCRSTTAISP